MRTKFSSYCINGIAKGCKQCVKGRKLVLFITGKCSRKCPYCSLSKRRKNKDVVWANERLCRNEKEIIKETLESRAAGAGITGGDPLLFFNRTIKYALALKKRFGKNFHIHIYLPTKLVTREKLEKLSKVVDEVRFHPSFLIYEKSVLPDIEKIKIAKEFFKKSCIGVELPIIPDKKKEIFDFILKIQNDAGFVNLNEFEISDTNFKYVIKKYNLKKGGYIISGSKEAGLWIFGQAEKKKLKLRIHLCTAELKNLYQYKNRLKLHNIFPYGKRTSDGTVIYLAVYSGKNHWGRFKKRFSRFKNLYFDEKKKRAIFSQNLARKFLTSIKIERVEEFPTWDGVEVEREAIN